MIGCVWNTDKKIVIFVFLPLPGIASRKIWSNSKYWSPWTRAWPCQCQIGSKFWHAFKYGWICTSGKNKTSCISYLSKHYLKSILKYDIHLWKFKLRCKHKDNFYFQKIVKIVFIVQWLDCLICFYASY